jgi:hypothetical protein
MSLEKHLELIEDEHARLVIEIREQDSKLSKLKYRQEELELEIMETKRTLLIKSGGLNLNDKFRLKEDLDQIGHMLSGLREKYSMNLKLVDCEVDDTYKISVSGELSDCKVNICTKSENVKSIVRKCFTQAPHCYESDDESELEKTIRNEWYEGPYSCCSRSFKYNVEQTKELYNENEDQKEKYDNWISSGKHILY